MARSEQPEVPGGLKVLKWFEAASASACNLCVGKFRFGELRVCKTIPHVSVHSCLWLSSQHHPTDQEGIV